jgi:small-conductance mechanosensitive channel
MKAIGTHPMVLKDPLPTILFEKFGDSAFMFIGYFWMELISNRDNRIAVSEIRHAITELLEKAGIVISFPQRDVHVDMADLSMSGSYAGKGEVETQPDGLNGFNYSVFH